MKYKYIITLVIASVVLIFGITGCGKEENVINPITSEKIPYSATNVAEGGTTLISEGVSIYCTNFFKWTFEKTMDQTPDTICDAECKDIEVTVKATKGMQVPGFNGKICLKNTGGYATENLTITVTLMKSCEGGDYMVVRENVPVSVSQKPVLGSGESYCYGYQVNVAQFGGIDPSCMYKIVANVTITNYVENIGYPDGISPESTPLQGCPPSNDCVTVMDVPGVILPGDPEVPTTGWNITVSPQTLEFCESGTAIFILHVCNNGVPAEETFTAENKLVVDGIVVDTAYYYLTTLDCTPGGGCTRTIGFYKTHAVKCLYGRNPDMVSAYLPIYLGTPMGAKTVTVTTNRQVVLIMKRDGPGGSSNGILKLYAQLLAAKLNIAGANGTGMGSDGSCISGAIAEADNFLATHNARDWFSLGRVQKNMVLEWVKIFDDYNNGLLCAPHCSNDGKPPHHRKR